MVADPLLCGPGPTLTRLRRCSRLNRGEPCLCRFLINDLAEDLDEFGAETALEWFDSDIDPDDMEDLVRELKSVIAAAQAKPVSDDGLEKAQAWLARFRGLAVAGSGLTGRYTEELDE